MSSENEIKREVRARIKRVRTALRRGGKNSALLVSSAPLKTKTRDLHHRYIQDSDFYYLTESALQGATLIVFGDNDPVLLSPERSKQEILWDGKGADAKKIARRIGAKYIATKSVPQELKKLLKENSTVFYPNTAGQAGYEFARGALALPSHRRSGPPISLTHTDAILEPLRVKKSPYEVKHHIEAIRISKEALTTITPYITPGKTEREIAERLESEIRLRGGEVAFPTIVGGGENGATLHHTPGKRKLKDGELVLIDFGASYRGYAADITRCLPVGEKKLPTKLRELYLCVLEAHEKIVKKVRPGRVWSSLYLETCNLLTIGLKDIGLLKGSLPSLRKKNAIKEYFPHSLGHALGIDVHDLGAFRSTGKAKLEPGVLVTVEPGLYFPKGKGRLPACGIRIEDDLLITRSGSRNLTTSLSKELL